MMRCSYQAIARHVLRLSLMFLASYSLTGCGSHDSQTATGLTCRVSIDGQVTQDVHVLLKPTSTSQSGAVLEGITNHLGIANLQLVDGEQLPTTEVIELRAAVESLGDWQIIKPWTDLESSPLVVTWKTGDEQIEINLPKKCVRAF